MQYTYTKSGLIGGLSYEEKDGKVRSYAYTYANDELPTKSTHPDGSNIQWTYDVLRRSTKTVFTPKSGVADGKKLYTTYAYQDGKHSVNGSTKTTTTGLVKTYTNKFGNSGSAVSKFDYTYDSWGNITKITDKASKNRTYTYNAYGEVTKATEAYSNGTTTTYNYTYDAGGNILTEKAGSTTHTYKYDSVWKDKLISYDGKSITYDVFGCPLNYMGSAMTWDVNGNLTNITKGSTKISYSYLSGGQRSSKTVNGTKTTYSYNNGMLLSETTGNETLRYYYDSVGRVASIGYQKGSAAEVGYFFTRNFQGDIIGVYRSSDSKLIGTYEYDLWGKLISTKEASKGIDTNGILTKNPFRYRGYYYDNETGFYNLNLRYYDPAIRRFISADTMDVLLIGTDGIHCKNLFAYTENNPVNGQDSSGAVVETVWDVASLGVSIADVCMNPTDLWAWGGLAGDVADCLIPCVGGIGEVVKGIRLAKMADTADDVKDGIKAVDNLHDVGKGIKSGIKAVPNRGFSSFADLKKYLGSPGEGNAWHHIVEQSQIGTSGFSSNEVNNVNNIIAIPHGKGTVHAKISGYYSSIPASGFTNGLTVRQWLSGQSFEQQFEFGMNVLKQYGDVIATSDGWQFIPFD